MAPPHQRPVLALAIRLLAMALIAGMSALVKLASEAGVHLAEIIFWRQALTLPLLVGALAATRHLGQLRTERIPIHGRRAMLGLIGMFLNLGSVTLLPLAEATTLSFVASLFAVMLSTVLLRERVGAIRWLAVALGFAGVIIITSPGHSTLPALGLATGIGAAFMNALIAIQVRDLGRTERPVTIVFWFSLFSTVLLAAILPFVITHHDTRTWLLLAAIGLSGLAGQLALTAALRLGPVSSVIVMDYTSLFWATLFGWLVWSHLPPASTWAGAPIIIAAGLVIVWRENRLARTKPIGPVAS
ncbi:DMT family transporter [Novosphingobium tardum]|uniref:DMT family transporter n=1 Tax=Novosphingobium tardum TaxID=1538021 RepID=A0ABV8RN33_9SPHN